MDNFDRAQDLDARYLQQALEQRQVKPKGDSRSHCIDCEVPIPQKRQDYIKGVERCVQCQEAFERGT